MWEVRAHAKVTRVNQQDIDLDQAVSSEGAGAGTPGRQSGGDTTSRRGPGPQSRGK
jgi:hypothetical protein